MFSSARGELNSRRLRIISHVIHPASLKLANSLGTGRKLNVYKTFRRHPEHLMYVQFTSCVYGEERKKNERNCTNMQKKNGGLSRQSLYVVNNFACDGIKCF